MQGLSVLASVIGYIVISLFAIVLALFMGYRIHETSSKARFRGYFGCKPEKDNTLREYQNKKIVTPTLKSFANDLQVLFDQEISILIQMSRGEGEYEDLKTCLKNTQKEIRIQKKVFYNSLETAKKLGFVVKEKHQDYLV